MQKTFRKSEGVVLVAHTVTAVMSVNLDGYGDVVSEGSVLSGFTVAHTGTGLYTVTFDQAVAKTLTVSALVENPNAEGSGGLLVCQLVSRSGSGFVVEVRDGVDGSLFDAATPAKEAVAQYALVLTVTMQNSNSVNPVTLTGPAAD